MQSGQCRAKNAGQRIVIIGILNLPAAKVNSRFSSTEQMSKMSIIVRLKKRLVRQAWLSHIG
jgi:hypothetical protein